MSGNERDLSMDGHTAGTTTPTPPELLPPQPMLRPEPTAAAAVIAIGIAAGIAFMSFGDLTGPASPSSGTTERDKVFSVSADETTGAFKVLPTSFQNSPGTVIAQLKMPEAEKARLRE